ncbi:SacI domain-containing protein [Trichophyton equinum CBS 127.97]|uniref:SacI domain-containing protein n=1 Tax=Trichophyton equinum (strain ATCC MYA-4606 / CBS 127.97) TaxID=559882 RepID=F2Q4Y4_TRIEC|nr:SacI domain-containing protein [Trichophyton equinum CBS 127.97]
MPGLARKLLIIAAVDGLILQPYHNNTRSSANLVQVDYKTHHIHSPARVSNYQYKNDACLESHGLIASKAIRQAQRALENSPDAYELSDSESDNPEDFLADEHNNFDAISPEGDLYPPVDEPSNEISIAEDVIKKRGRYGRFTAEWFARKGWGSIGLSDSRRRSLISSSDGSAHAESMELKNLGADALDAPESKETSENTSMTDARTHDLLPKLLKYTKMMFGSRSFYFSYDYDITRRFGPVDPASTHVPLCHQANPLANKPEFQQYFWNRHLMKPFMDSGRHTFTLPIMQGFIGQHEFTAESIMQSSPEGDSQVKSPEEGDENTEKASEDASVDGNRNFLLTLISRRSVLRSGVRYLRRGIDDDGNTANSVETEQILSSPSWNPAEKVYSLLQLQCRGMKFENVSRLVDRMSGTLEDFGDTVVQNNAVVRSQSGVIRTNCMDCLDRTGVSQCAFGQWALEKQLKEEGYYIDLQGSAATQWFNILWADNGDAISKQYSSTAALKGDYTRTRKRDYRGALNDLGLTLTRYYTNIFTDYFSQACIDYLLGNVTTRVFDEFETNLQSADPGISMEKARQSAIETSCQIVISDENEEFIGGWTMLSPRQPNTLRTLPFEQTVLLLTNVAVYSCRFDCNTEKVTSFERIDLTSITGIKYGTYISSTLTDAQRDEKRNMGLAIAYRPSTSNSLRVNTTSLHSLFAEKPDPAQENQDIIDWDLSTLFKGSDRSSTHFLAFKLPNTSSAVARAPKTPEVSEADAVRAICEEIERMVNRATQSPSIHTERPSIVEQTQIISLENARRQTGYFEHLFFDIKKLVWA